MTQIYKEQDIDKLLDYSLKSDGEQRPRYKT